MRLLIIILDNTYFITRNYLNNIFIINNNILTTFFTGKIFIIFINDKNNKLFLDNEFIILLNFIKLIN